MRRLLGRAWHPDIPATLHDIISNARAHRGRIGGCVVALAEMIDLAKVAARQRFGRHTPITSGAHPPSQQPDRSWSPRSMADDFRNGWIRIARNPRASFGIVALLALAIGVTSAMFAIVDAFLLSPAPFRDAGTLYRLGATVPRGQKALSEPDIAKTLRASDAFAAVHASGLNAVGDVESPTGTHTLSGSWVEPGVFRDLGVRPILGREFEPGEGTEGRSALVLLSEEAWRTHFNADPSVVGSTIRVSNQAMTVVGVMPAHLRFPIRGAGIWRPYDIDRPSSAAQRSQILLYARRHTNVPEADTIARAAGVLQGANGATYTVELRSAAAGLLDAYSRESIITLSVGVGLLFLLLCLNVTNLILARAATRQSEYGVCTALGASRARLVRQALVENIVLGFIGALAGLALAVALIEVSEHWMPEDLAWRTLNPLDVDIRVVAATSLIGMLAALLAGLPAALLGTRTNVSNSLRLATRAGSESKAARRVSTLLLTGEIALAVALLAAAGLQVRSFTNLVYADRGVAATDVQVATVSMPERLFPDATARGVVVQSLETQLAALPGVQRTTSSLGLPPEGGSIHFSYAITTDLPNFTPVEIPFMFGYRVSSGFFDTLGIRITAGRDFVDDDPAETAIVSKQLASTVFGDVDPVGHTFAFSNQTFRVVGVADEVRNTLTDPRQDYPELYTHRSRAGRRASTSTAIAIRCADPCASQASIREVITRAQAGVELVSLAPLSDAFMEQLARPQTATAVATGFAGLALAATAVGLFGIMSQAVSRRRREFGIRAAVGADPADLRRLVLAGALRVTVAGLIAGVGAGWALGRWLESVQYGVTFFDPVTWGTVAIVVSLVSVAACWAPARTAMKINPVSLLRES